MKYLKSARFFMQVGVLFFITTISVCASDNQTSQTQSKTDPDFIQALQLNTYREEHDPEYKQKRAAEIAAYFERLKLENLEEKNK